MSQAVLSMQPSTVKFTSFSLRYCYCLLSSSEPAWTRKKAGLIHLKELLFRRHLYNRKFSCPYFIASHLLYRRLSPVCTKDSLILHCLGCIPDTERVRCKFQEDLISVFLDQTQNTKLHSETRISLQLKFFINTLQQRDLRHKKWKLFTYSPLQHSSTFQYDH